MKWIELIKLRLRAKKYRTKDDIGGVAFILSALHEGNTALDIGAHKGGYLYLMLKKVGDQGKIVAFEPQTVLHTYLSHLKKLLKWNNVTIEHIALSDTETETTLFIPTNHVSNASAPGATILNNRERDDIGFTEKVNTDSLDHYCSVYSIEPNFLKIDVEGNELNIFKGGMLTLKKNKPRIIVECDAGYVGENQVLETFELLKGLGYTGSFIFESQRLPLSEFSFEKYQNRNSTAFFCNNFIFE